MQVESPNFSIFPKTSALLDAVRSVAALAVVANHFRNLFSLDYQDAGPSNVFVRAIYFMTGLGHSAVMVFFVLSGLLVSQGIFKQLHRKRWTWMSYLIQRFSRLLIVLWPALLLTFLLDWVGMSLFGTSGIYGGNPSAGNIISSPVLDRTTIAIYGANAFFLQGVLTPTAGSNGPLWSLSNEGFYYLLFPLLVCLLGPQQPARRLVSGALLIGLVVGLLPLAMTLYFGIWLMGSAVAWGWSYLPRASTALVGPRLVSAMLLAAALCLARGLSAGFAAQLVPAETVAPILDGLIGITTAVFLFYMMRGTGSDESPQVSMALEGAKRLSRFSYSLYLTHLPMLVFLQAWLIGNGSRWQPSVGNLLVGIFIGALVIACAYLFSLMTEEHTEWLRKRITSLTSSSSVA